LSSPPPPSLLHPELPDGVERTPVPEPPRRGLAAVPAWAPFVAMLATFVLASVVSILIAGVAQVGGARVEADSLPPGVLISGTLVQDAALVLFAYLFARGWTRPVRPSTFGLRPTAWRPAIAWAAAVYAGFWVCAGIYSAVIGQGPEQDLVNDLRDQDSFVVLAGFAVLVALVAPIVEEVFFRGFLFGVLREHVGVPYAALVAGAVFGVIHAAGTPLRTLGILVILGVGLCLLYQKTGSILPGIGLHALHNSLSFAATKGLVWWGFLLMMAVSVGVVLFVASFVVAREQRIPAPT
jgi:uncharacterized protein